jgi:4-amino-4-deoxy-L-arabinose transferase-like glycosyltransferase
MAAVAASPARVEVVAPTARVRPRAIVVLGLAAVLIRAVYVVDGTQAGWAERDDAAHYQESAARLASGLPLPPTPHWVPLYPIVLSPFYFLFGPHWVVARLANAILGGVACALLIPWTARAFDREAALLAGALYAVYPPSIAHSGHIMSENLLVPLLLAVCLALSSCSERPTIGRAAALGALLGLASMTHGDAVVLLVLVVGRLAFAWRRALGRSGWKYLGAIVLAYVVMLVPWTIRNHRLFGRLIPLTTSAGPTLLDGNNDTSRGRATDRRALPQELQRALQRAAPIERDVLARRLALEWMKSNPDKLIPLSILKLGELWSPRTAFFFRSPTRHPRLQEWTPPLIFPFLLVMGWLGVLYAPPRAARAGLWLVFAQAHIVALVFFGLDRYRLALATLWVAPAAWVLSGGRRRAHVVGWLPPRKAPLLVSIVIAILLAPSWWDVVAGYVMRLKTVL